ncbi:MAG: hypothetical protein WEB90_08390 [Gemmatimonadota bacterium]
MRAWLVTSVVLGLAACHTSVPALAEVGPQQTCTGQLVLEFTNRSAVAVQAGWITLAQLAADPTGGDPLWLGVVGVETARYDVPAAGRVIFRTAVPGVAPEERHDVGYRILCRTS